MKEKFKKLKRLITTTKTIYNYTSEIPKDSYEVVNHPDLVKWVLEFKSLGHKLEDIQKVKINGKGWELNDLTYFANVEFNELRRQRHNGYDFINTPYYCDLLKTFCSLTKSFYNIGRESNKKKQERIDFTKLETSDRCSSYQENYVNSHEDYGKKMANLISSHAKEQNIDIVVCEELNSNIGCKETRTKRDNEMYLMWNCGDVKRFLENQLKDIGIVMTEISEFMTSQIDNETGNIGYRDGRAFYSRRKDGKIYKLHADINAATNIANKYITRHSDVYTVKVVEDKSKKSIYILDKKFLADEEGGKRKKWAIYSQFKTFDYTFDLEPTDVVTKGTLFRVNNKWVTKEKKDAYVDGIREEIQSK